VRNTSIWKSENLARYALKTVEKYLLEERKILLKKSWAMRV
jgi:hypothetical protein